MRIALIIAVILAVVIAGCSKDKSPYDNSKILSDPLKECARVNGTWMMFSNGCVDSCYSARSARPVMCTQALTESCECGPDRCWNGSTCEPN